MKERETTRTEKRETQELLTSSHYTLLYLLLPVDFCDTSTHILICIEQKFRW